LVMKTTGTVLRADYRELWLFVTTKEVISVLEAVIQARERSGSKWCDSGHGRGVDQLAAGDCRGRLDRLLSGMHVGIKEMDTSRETSSSPGPLSCDGAAVL